MQCNANSNSHTSIKQVKAPAVVDDKSTYCTYPAFQKIEISFPLLVLVPKSVADLQHSKQQQQIESEHFVLVATYENSTDSSSLILSGFTNGTNSTYTTDDVVKSIYRTVPCRGCRSSAKITHCDSVPVLRWAAFDQQNHQSHRYAFSTTGGYHQPEGLRRGPRSFSPWCWFHCS